MRLLSQPFCPGNRRITPPTDRLSVDLLVFFTLMVILTVFPPMDRWWDRLGTSSALENCLLPAPSWRGGLADDVSVLVGDAVGDEAADDDKEEEDDEDDDEDDDCEEPRPEDELYSCCSTSSSS